MYIRKNLDATLDIVSDQGTVIQRNVPLIIIEQAEELIEDNSS